MAGVTPFAGALCTGSAAAVPVPVMGCEKPVSALGDCRGGRGIGF